MRIHRISDVVFSTDGLSYEDILGIIDEARGVRANFKIVPSRLEFIVGKASVETIEDVPLVELDYNIDKWLNRLTKRVFDVVMSFILLVFGAPFAIAYGIVGRRALRRIKLLNRLGKPVDGFVLTATDGIPRTVLGKYPLLMSVMWGDLSLVGSELRIDGKGDAMPSKPGLTGLVQLGRDFLGGAAERERYEHYYARSQSLRLDMEILLKTIFRV